ncbi:MAG: hypothetical protein AAF460_18350 [Pseudomonadota bacterium]
MATFTHQQVSATRRRLRLTLAAGSIAAVFSLSGCALWETAPADEPIAELPSAEDIAIVAAPTPQSDVPRTAALERK